MTSAVAPSTNPAIELAIRAVGHPAKQGSKDFKGMRGGRPVLVEADEKLPEWRQTVVDAARSAMRAHGAWITLTDAAALDVTVWLPRPKSVTRPHPIGAQDGDADKYLRAVSDCMTIARVWSDDKLAVRSTVEKRYADGRPPGAVIRVRLMQETLI